MDSHVLNGGPLENANIPDNFITTTNVTCNKNNMFDFRVG